MKSCMVGRKFNKFYTKKACSRIPEQAFIFAAYFTTIFSVTSSLPILALMI